MPYKNLEDRRRVARDSMRRKHGFKPRGEGKRGSGGNLTPTLTPGHDKGEFNPWASLARVYPWLRPEHNKGQRRLLDYLCLGVDDLVQGVHLVHTATGEYRDLSGLLDTVRLLEERVVALSYAVAELQADAIDAPMPEEIWQQAQ